MRLEIILDATGTQADIHWSEGWRGGAIEGHLDKGRWVLVETESRIT